MGLGMILCAIDARYVATKLLFSQNYAKLTKHDSSSDSDEEVK
jgi:hypothetical protein